MALTPVTNSDRDFVPATSLQTDEQVLPAPPKFISDENNPPLEKLNLIHRIAGFFSDLYMGELVGAVVKKQPIDRQAVKTALYAQMSDERANQYESTFADAALIFIPGLLNFFPSTDFFNDLSAPFEYGGLILGMGQHEPDHFETRGNHTILGGNSRVLHPDWRCEVAFALYQLIRGLDDEKLGLKKASHWVILGHSKGGLVAQSLAALALDFAKNQTLPDYALKLFPGIQKLPQDKLEIVLNHLAKDSFHALGSPLEGIERTKGVDLFDNLVLAGSVHFFDRNFIAEHFKAIGHGPEILDKVITVQLQRDLKEALKSNFEEEDCLQNAVYKAAQALFQGGAFITGAQFGDAMVPALNTRLSNHHHIQEPCNHVEAVVRPDMAHYFLPVLAEALVRKTNKIVNLQSRPFRKLHAVGTPAKSHSFVSQWHGLRSGFARLFSPAKLARSPL